MGAQKRFPRYPPLSAGEILEVAVDKYPTLQAFSGDVGYQGGAVEFTSTKLGMTLNISEKIDGKWAVLPKRWVVERLFSWLGHFRRLSKDFEILPAATENMILIAMLKITLAKCIYCFTRQLLNSNRALKTRGLLGL